ncbi:MAG: tetratricopeptide repeat protein [Bryobacterales bacterium]|nr:tetratricopeptide repeat protein [Bryobacterales bacterium]
MCRLCDLTARRSEDNARRKFGEVVLYYPPKLPDTAENELYLAVAQAYRADGRHRFAIRNYEEALRRKPGSLHLANLLAMGQELIAAIAHYRRATEAAPDVAETHYNLGAALGMSKDYSGAKREFERVLELKPDYFAAHLNLGNLERVSGNRALAVGHCEKAMGSPDRSIREAALKAIGSGE